MANWQFGEEFRRSFMQATAVGIAGAEAREVAPDGKRKLNGVVGVRTLEELMRIGAGSDSDPNWAIGTAAAQTGSDHLGPSAATSTLH